jgi:hypothetical protein
VTDELAVLDSLGGGVDHRGAERVLSAAGWLPCGAGDWAVVLASPSGRLAARISPFDPVAPYTVELFRRAAATSQVPRLDAYRELEGGAVCTVMERLHAAGKTEAAVFFESLEQRRPGFEALAAAVDAVLSRARAELPWCGALDPNPANVMRRDDGGLVLTDPFFADGPNLYGSLRTDPSLVAERIAADRRRHMFDLPLAESGPWDPADRERLRAALARADREAAHRSSRTLG